MTDQEYIAEPAADRASSGPPAAVGSGSGGAASSGPPESSSKRPSLRQAFGALRDRAFRQWFASQVLSASGTMTQGIAQTWLVLKLTGSAVDLGLMASFSFLPLLVGGPWAGALVDRFDTRRLLIVTQSLLFTSAMLLATLVATGSERLWMLYLIALATGTVAAPDAAARQVYVFELVGGGRVASAVGLYEVVLNASRVLGPAVGGALLATVGVAACCFFNAAAYLLPLGVLIAHGSRARRSRAATRRRGAEPGGRLAGLKYAWGHPEIRIILLLAAASGMLFGLGVPVALLASRVFALGGGGYGLMMAVFGIGALPGALLAGAGNSSPSGRSVAALAVATGLAVMATAYAPDLVLLLPGLAVTGCLSIWFIARANTLVQLAADPAMRGRVMAVWSMALPGCSPLTSPAVGWVCGTAGPRLGFAMAGIALVCIAVAGWRALAGKHPVTGGRALARLAIQKLPSAGNRD